MQFDPKRNYVMQWNFNIQREITPETTLMVGYVGARGLHMRFQADDVNMVYPDAIDSPHGPIGHDQLRMAVRDLAPVTATGSKLPHAAGTVFNPAMGRTQMAMGRALLITTVFRSKSKRP